ncbi:MAG: hypothetical protein AABW63_01745 [Nanoarchaeota archaeon]
MKRLNDLAKGTLFSGLGAGLIFSLPYLWYDGNSSDWNNSGFWVQTIAGLTLFGYGIYRISKEIK